MLTSLAALILTAQAVPPPPVGQDDIVVTGQRPMTRGEIQHHVAEIAATEQSQLARFHFPICPSVVGMAPEHADIITARIREIAAQSGAEEAPTPCVPNVTLIVVPDGRELMKKVRSTLIFADLDPWEIRKLMREGPVRVWNRTQIVNEHFQGTGGSTPADPDGGGRMRAYSASIVKEPTQQVILESFILIDDAAVIGKSLLQLADYAAMRTIADTRPPSDDAGAADTILTLFDRGAAAPPHATALDRAYLSSLYRSQALRTATQQKGRMSQLIERQLAPDRKEQDKP